MGNVNAYKTGSMGLGEQEGTRSSERAQPGLNTSQRRSGKRRAQHLHIFFEEKPRIYILGEISILNSAN